MLLDKDEDTRVEFYHDIFDYFSNTDDNLPPSVIYNDFVECMRLGGVCVPDDLESSYIEEDFLNKGYDKNAS